jgi:glycosyltransferase involved in cell wall biosynthesis
MSQSALAVAQQPHSRPSSRPRVVIVSAVAYTIDVFLTQQIRGMLEAGYDVTVVCSPGKEFNRFDEHGFDWYPIPIPRSIKPFGLARAAWQLYRFFRSTRPSIVHTHTPIAAFLGQLAAWKARVPHRVTTVHGLYFVSVTNRVLRGLFRTLEVAACRIAHRVICVTDEDTQYLVRQQRLPDSKLMTLHVGVDLDAHCQQSAGDAQRRLVRQTLDIPQDAVVFGIVARMVREKGFEELFQAFAQLCQSHRNIYLVHVGPVDDCKTDAITPQDAKRHGCFDRCRFAGIRHDVPQFLAAMDVFCLPSHREGYPVSIMEAAAMGLPCITTDIRGCRDAVLDGKTGLVIPPRNARALAAAMERLLLSSTLRAKMSQNAVRRAREQFDRRLVVVQTVRLYQRMSESVGAVHRP